jgi:hypothetical protein
MWLLTDEDMRELLGGEFSQVVTLKKIYKDISIRKLYGFQFTYFSYQGFRQFYKKYLEPIVETVKYIEDDSIVGKILKFFLRVK